jgi:hypothetical protein
MERVPILVYTHTEYVFMWKAMVPLLKRYADKFEIHWLYEKTADQNLIQEWIPSSWIQHTFDETDIWTLRVGKCLLEIDSEYVLFLHEDWLPTNMLSPQIVSDMASFMKKEKCGFLCSYCALVRNTTRHPGIFTGYDNYYFYPEDNHIFQPAIWDMKIFREFCFTLKKAKKDNEDRECLDFMGARRCWSVQNKETMLTLRTTNSLFFPHMHALSEGLWNFRKYPTLKAFLEAFGIETTTRGVHSWWELDTQ